MAKAKSAVDPSAAVKARVLVDCAWGAPNDVVEVSAEECAAGQAAGELDGNADAVAYAQSLIA